MGVDRREPGEGTGLQVDPWSRRIRACELGGGHGNRRGRQRVYDSQVWPGPHCGLLADSGNVDGVVCSGFPLYLADRWREPQFLRLVLRPATLEPADLGRAD